MEEYYDYYLWPYDEQMIDQMVAGLMGVLLTGLGIALLLALVFYVLESLALYSIAKRRGIRNPGLAWVPVGSSWIKGCVSDQFVYVTKGKLQNRRKLLLGLEIGAIALSLAASILELLLPAAGILFRLVVFGVRIGAGVIGSLALYDLYASCEPGRGVLYLVLSLTLGVTKPFLMFACRNQDKGMPPRKNARPGPQSIPEPDWQPAEPEQEPWDKEPEE